MSTPTARIARERLGYIIGWDRLSLGDPRALPVFPLLPRFSFSLGGALITHWPAR